MMVIKIENSTSPASITSHAPYTLPGKFKRILNSLSRGGGTRTYTVRILSPSRLARRCSS
jgi:hypothetical protein